MTSINLQNAEMNIEKMDGLEEKASNDNRSRFLKLTDIYFKPKFFERSGRIYEVLGVKSFKKLLMGTIGKIRDESFSGNYHIGNGEDRDISYYENWTRFNEAIHMPLAILAGSRLGPNIAEGDILWTSLAILATLVNGYCAMLQRYNRARAYRILEKKEGR